MGLSPVKIGDDRPDLFLDLAKEQGAIDQRIFSLNFSGDHTVSYVTLGGYDTSQYAVEELTWHKNLSENFWSVQLDEVKFGDTILQQNSSVTHKKLESIVDSGSSYLLLPERKFHALVKELKKITTCTVDWYN